jgi:hypothetical protein
MTRPGGRASSRGQWTAPASRRKRAWPHAPTALTHLSAQSWGGQVFLVSQHGHSSGDMPVQSSIGADMTLLIPVATGGTTSPSMSSNSMKARRMTNQR